MVNALGGRQRLTIGGGGALNRGEYSLGETGVSTGTEVGEGASCGFGEARGGRSPWYLRGLLC